MPTDTLTAKANVGAGTDGLAGITTAQGFAGAVMLVNSAGADVDAATPLPVAVASTQRTASLTRATSSGTVSAGAKSVSFGNFGSANATVAGTNLEPNESADFNAPLGDTLAAIAYDGTGTELLIAEVR